MGASARAPGWLLAVALLPLVVLLYVGGVIGVVFGAIAAGVNLGLARASWSPRTRLLAILGVGLAAAALALATMLWLSGVLESSW